MADRRITRIMFTSSMATIGLRKLLRPVLPHAIMSVVGHVGDLKNVGSDCLIVFPDGPTLHPDEYGCPDIYPNVGTHNRNRDSYEHEIWVRTYKSGCKYLGVGRGSHLLWVAMGGDLIQHVTNHEISHEVADSGTGEIVEVKSCHVQAVHQGTLLATVLAYDTTATTQKWFAKAAMHECTDRASVDRPLTTVEAWSLIGILGIQFRPDLSGCPVAGRILFYDYLRNVILEE